MLFESNSKHSKIFLVKVYANLSQLATVLKNITQKNGSYFQLSIFGKLTPNDFELSATLEETVTTIRKNISTALGKKIQLSQFHHPDIGTLFIAGHLTPTFITKIEDKQLGASPAGLNGIFRGLGVDMDAYQYYIDHLKNGSYLLFIRSEMESLSNIKSILEAL
jgi:hypothetical protein